MTPKQRFLQMMIAKGGKQAYVALLMLGAQEHQKKELLQRFDIKTIRKILWQARIRRISKMRD